MERNSRWSTRTSAPARPTRCKPSTATAGKHRSVNTRRGWRAVLATRVVASPVRSTDEAERHRDQARREDGDGEHVLHCPVETPRGPPAADSTHLAQLDRRKGRAVVPAARDDRL